MEKNIVNKLTINFLWNYTVMSLYINTFLLYDCMYLILPIMASIYFTVYTLQGYKETIIACHIFI